MKFGYEHEEAVSPVIGVILMVAITVILAATVGVFVLGMGSDMKAPKEVVIVASTNATGTSITLQGGKDLSQLEELKIKTNGAAITGEVWVNGAEDPVEIPDGGYLTASAALGDDATVFGVGDTIFLNDIKKGTLLVTGKFSDGEEKIILQKTL